MISLILIKLLLIFVSSTISQPTLPWNLTLTARAIEPLVRDNSGSLTNQRTKYQTFNDNTNFGIIIKQGTTFSLTVETPSKIEDLKFFCFPYPQHEKKLIKLNLTGKTNCTNTLTTNYDCVPMVSASKNVPLRMIIKTKNWFPLSTNNSNDVSLPKSQGKGISHKIENNLKYSFHALGYNDLEFLTILINYKNMTIELQQLQKKIHSNFQQEVYFWISLERNGLSIFEYKFLGCPPCGTKLINAVEKFELNDVIHFYHAEPGRFKSNLEGLNYKKTSNSFILSNTGLETLK
ncbi:uncharacterized protein LOC127286175 [Leptopilina boulardi]|uniref:uncharacterized protein LOC127286175 n=1 Tax=Leptopilina boulardi TaxID=63433 RepID=UPI0021F6175F|nr:uncharacterized protein LOC127286175 [Leptopilina boulardi]